MLIILGLGTSWGALGLEFPDDETSTDEWQGMPQKCYTCPAQVPIKKGGGRRPPPRIQHKAQMTKPNLKDAERR